MLRVAAARLVAVSFPFSEVPTEPGECRVDCPFPIERIYWCYDTPDGYLRGRHAHRDNEQVVIVLRGQADVRLESPQGQTHRYSLGQPDRGLYVPRMHWREIRLSPGAVLLCLASQPFSEADYIRDYAEFRQVRALHTPLP